MARAWRVIGVAALVGALAGCGGADDEPDPSVAPEPQGSATTTAEASSPVETQDVSATTDPATAPAELSADERAVVDAFVALALDPTAEHAGAVPFASPVVLGLGLAAHDEVAGDPADVASWTVDGVDLVFGRTPPFNALTTIAESTTVTTGAGPHDHCAGPPLALLRVDHDQMLWIQPDGAASCLDWFAVDLYLDDGEVVAVSLAFWEP